MFPGELNTQKLLNAYFAQPGVADFATHVPGHVTMMVRHATRTGLTLPKGYVEAVLASADPEDSARLDLIEAYRVYQGRPTKTSPAPRPVAPAPSRPVAARPTPPTRTLAPPPKPAPASAPKPATLSAERRREILSSTTLGRKALASEPAPELHDRQKEALGNTSLGRTILRRRAARAKAGGGVR